MESPEPTHHGLSRIIGADYVGDAGYVYLGYCLCGWGTGKDPSWRSAGKRVEDHVKGMAK